MIGTTKDKSGGTGICTRKEKEMIKLSEWVDTREWARQQGVSGEGEDNVTF